ncbi:hypothetical protein B566_EDAN018277 [Ephemera danica]|nr:hypothetical protein B566_EDAN018277 [Ephemera danica]
MKIPYQVPPQRLNLTTASARTYEVEEDALNDPDVFLYNFALSDATAPGSKKDPFYLNPLLSEAILEKYEADFTKWLNSVLTPPEELGTGEVTGKVNAADLWTRSTRTGAANTLAPTRETVTFRYLSVQYTVQKSKGIVKTTQRIEEELQKPANYLASSAITPSAGPVSELQPPLVETGPRDCVWRHRSSALQL